MTQTYRPFGTKKNEKKYSQVKLKRDRHIGITIPKSLRVNLESYCKNNGGRPYQFVGATLHHFLTLNQNRQKKILVKYGDISLTKALRTKKIYYPIRNKLEKRIPVQFYVPKYLADGLENFSGENNLKRAHITAAAIHHFLSLSNNRQGKIVTKFGEYCLAKTLINFNHEKLLKPIPE